MIAKMKYEPEESWADFYAKLTEALSKSFSEIDLGGDRA
jgi:hypothetical protein